jgi:hypothetical protein
MKEMAMRVFMTARVLAMTAVLAAGVAALGQVPAAPAAPAPCDASAKNTANCAAPAATPPKSTAERFPFPGEEPSAPDKPVDVTPDAPSGTPDAPSDSTPAAPSPQTKTPHAPQPYPGDPDAANAPAGSSSGSSSSSSSSSSGNPGDSPAAGDDADGLKDAGSSGDDTKTPARRRRLPKTAPETPESRAAEDLTVADFYQKDGNYLGAYDRAKDAVQYQPDDPYTHFALAEAALKLGKRDEAKEQYTQVLKLDPIPKQLKASQKALEELASAKK